MLWTINSKWSCLKWILFLSPLINNAQFLVAKDIRLDVKNNQLIEVYIPGTNYPRTIEVFKTDTKIGGNKEEPKGTVINTYRKRIRSSWIAIPGKYTIRVYKREPGNKMLIDEVTFVVEPTKVKR